MFIPLGRNWDRGIDIYYPFLVSVSPSLFERGGEKNRKKKFLLFFSSALNIF